MAFVRKCNPRQSIASIAAADGLEISLIIRRSAVGVEGIDDAMDTRAPDMGAWYSGSHGPMVLAMAAPPPHGAEISVCNANRAGGAG